MMTRNEAREEMMKIMYEMDAANIMKSTNASKLANERLRGPNRKRGKNLLSSIVENIGFIDKVINEGSKSWKTSRMPKVDLAIMRLAIGELIYSDDVPDAVVINEAINIAKKYSTERSSKYIHGVLGAVLKNGLLGKDETVNK